MADTSSYSIVERLVASVWVHERQHTGRTMSQVIAAFRERFNKAPPRRATLLDWEKRAFALGSVKDTHTYIYIYIYIYIKYVDNSNA